MADIEQLHNEILADMYNEADPGLDWYDLLEHPEQYPDDYYLHHALSSERQKEIFDEHTERVSLTRSEHASLSISVFMDKAPASPKS